MYLPSASVLSPLFFLLLSESHAFIVGPTIKSAVTVAKCLDTTGTMSVPNTNTNINFTFNHVGKYPCVLNNAASKGAARAAPGDDPSPDFTVGKDIETEIGEGNCLKVTGTIQIPGVGSAGVTFKHVDKYACMFSIVGEIGKGGAVNSTSSDDNGGGSGGSPGSSATATASVNAASATGLSAGGDTKHAADEHSSKTTAAETNEGTTENSNSGGESDDSCSSS